MHNLSHRILRGAITGLLLIGVVAGGQSFAQSSPPGFTTGYRYDGMRRLTGVISPDPDGPGGNAHQAVRNTYDANGRLIKVEKGELAVWASESTPPASWSGFTIHTVTDITYDAGWRKAKETVSSGGGSLVIQTVTQYSYDGDGRLECTAVRMNPAAFGALPASACTLGTAGSQGGDRITRNFYDAAGQLLKVQKAVGTGVQIDYVRYEYTPNGKQKAVIDANGNRAEFVYDEFDRRTKWIFPSKTVPGAVDATDYEEYGYDANGNRTSLRKRDGRTIAYSYDALNRVTSKTYPGGGARPVYYAYDLRGLQTAARFDTASGDDAVLSAWDGFGRQVSSTTAMGGTSRILTYVYDANGNRTRIKWPDGHHIDPSWDGLDRFRYDDLPGGGHLNYVSYDNAGRASMHYRWLLGIAWWGAPKSYSYDGISRAASYTLSFQNGAADVTTSFGYNPASQIVSRTRDNDDYRFTGNVNVDRAYATNGLNQYSTAGSASFTYDANGNLTSDGTTSYTYDIENRLVSASTATTLTTLDYDPIGRLAQVSKGASTTQFLYDGDALVAEYDGSGSMLKRYVHGPAAGQDDPLVEYVGSSMSSPRYLYADHQGSIIAIADHNGNRIAVNGYDEYGIPNGYAGSGTPNTGRFQYTGQAWIPELGLYHYKARVYSPTLGRFLQTDPIGYDDQINLYAYVANDPINGRDPTGLFDCKDGECATIEQFAKGVRAAAHAASMTTGTRILSNRAMVLDHMSKTIGTMKDGNGVMISNDSLDPGTLGSFSPASDGGMTIKLDFEQIASAGGNPVGAGVLAHEVAHGVTHATWGDIKSLPDVMNRERYARFVESLVHENMGYSSFLWSPGMTDSVRRERILQGAHRSCAGFANRAQPKQFSGQNCLGK